MGDIVADRLNIDSAIEQARSRAIGAAISPNKSASWPRSISLLCPTYNRVSLAHMHLSYALEQPLTHDKDNSQPIDLAAGSCRTGHTHLRIDVPWNRASCTPNTIYQIPNGKLSQPASPITWEIIFHHNFTLLKHTVLQGVLKQQHMI